MPAPTVAVSVRLYGSDGAAQSGVLVTARLDKADEYEGFIVSDPVTGTTDADGLVVLDLFPNHPTTGLGTTGSVYTISATPAGAKRWSVQAQIPNQDCDLDDHIIVEVEPAETFTQTLAGSTGAGLVGLSHSASYAAGTVGAALQHFVSVADAPYNAVEDNATDAAAAIQAALDAGAGTVNVFGLCAIASTITIESDRRLVIHPGGGIKWIGAGGGTMFATPADDVVSHAAIISHGTIDYGSGANAAGIVFDMHSAFGFELDASCTGTSTTNTVLKIRADSSAGSGPTGTRNFAGSSLKLACHGECGKFISAAGQATPLQVVTVNTFKDLYTYKCHIKGIDLIEYADTNVFAGQTRIRIAGNDSIGVDLSSLDGVTNVGVYNIHFDALTVDGYGTYTGRIGLKLGVVRWVTIDYYYQDGTLEDEGGQVSIAASAVSYRIVREFPDASGALQTIEKGVRPNSAFAARNCAVGIANNSTSPTTVKYQFEEYDTNGDFDETTGVFTAPVKGKYEFSALVGWGVGGHSVDGAVFILAINNITTAVAKELRMPPGTTANPGSAHLAVVHALEAGDQVAARIRRSSTSTLGALTLESGNGSTCLFSGRFLHG